MDSIPYGKCHCGCGQDAKKATMTNRTRGVLAGHPMRYAPGHYKPKLTPEYLAQNPDHLKKNRERANTNCRAKAKAKIDVIRQTDPQYGKCGCGCGEDAPICVGTDNRTGVRRGDPYPYIQAHRFRSSPLTYIEQDHGYTTPCWIWQRSLDHRGYARVDGRRGNSGLLHRIMYESRKGVIPHAMQLDHLCRQRSCVNPDHLEPVTGTINVRRGNATKLTESIVRDIRVSNESIKVLAERYNITAGYVRDIQICRSWKDIA